MTDELGSDIRGTAMGLTLLVMLIHKQIMAINSVKCHANRLGLSVGHCHRQIVFSEQQKTECHENSHFTPAVVLLKPSSVCTVMTSQTDDDRPSPNIIGP